MATAAIVDTRSATNSRGCSPIATASRLALLSATESLRERLGTFLHPFICGSGEAPTALRHKLDGMMCRLEWQSYGHARPLAQSALDIDLAAMQMHQTLHNRKTKSRAVVTALARCMSLEECLAKSWQVGFDNADAGIRDCQREFWPVA